MQFDFDADPNALGLCATHETLVRKKAIA